MRVPGIHGYLRRRRERESAVPSAAVQELEAEMEARGSRRDEMWEQSTRGSAPDSADGESAGSPGMPLPGADARELGAMLARALATGHAQVSENEHEVRPDALHEEIAGLIRGAGARPDQPDSARGDTPDEPTP